MKKKVYLALDTSYQEGVVALFSHDELLFSSLLKEKMAHGQQICSSISGAITFAKENSFRLCGVFCGVGPGSFVGVRIALATALSFSFARGLPIFSICSHLSLAFSSHNDGPFYLFMKASGDKGYLSGFFAKNNKLEMTLKTKVIDVKELAMIIANGSKIYSDQAKRLSSIFKQKVIVENVLGPVAKGVMQASLMRFLEKDLKDESLFLRPNYVKSPNISKPKKQFCII